MKSLTNNANNNYNNSSESHSTLALQYVVYHCVNNYSYYLEFANSNDL